MKTVAKRLNDRIIDRLVFELSPHQQSRYVESWHRIGNLTVELRKLREVFLE